MPLQKADLILKKFDDAIRLSDAKPADAVVCKKLANFVERHLQSLSPLQRIDLMKTVYRAATAEIGKPREDPNTNPELMKALAKIYLSFPFDPAYTQHMRLARRAFQEVLLKDSWHREMRQGGWNADVEARPYFLKHVMMMHNKAMGHESLSFYANALSFGSAADGIAASYFRNEIKFRHHWRHSSFVMNCQMSSLLHENTHSHQDQLAVASRQDFLPPGSPFYRQAKFYAVFHAKNSDALYYVSGKGSREAYHAHPLEREARIAEGLIHRVARKIKSEQRPIQKPLSAHSPEPAIA